MDHFIMNKRIVDEQSSDRPTDWKMALTLFCHFVRIGAFTFGSGWSILAQIEQDFVERRGWITKNDLLELTAVGKSLPGIMVVNITMLFGYQMGGVLGGICAALGLTFPAVVILTLVTLVYDVIKSNYWVWAALRGVQCAVVPIIGGAAISLGKEALKTRMAIVLCLISFALCCFTNVSNIALVLGGAALSLIWMGVKEHGHA